MNILRLLCAAAVTLAVGMPGTSQVRVDCDYSHRGVHWLTAARNGTDYVIAVPDSDQVRKEMSYSGSLRPYSAAGQLPVGIPVFDAVEFLAREAGAAAFYVGRTGTRNAVPLDHVWRGATPLACLQSFVQAGGLEVVEPQPGFWLIGAPDAVDKAAILVFAYSPDTTLQPLQSEAAVGDLERALLAQLGTREVSQLALVGLGYYAVPGEPDTYLVVATHGANTNPSDGDDLRVSAYKVRVQRQGGKATLECLWRETGLPGPLLPAVQEDFDGDGVRDFYFQEAGDRDLPDLILSGADGSVLAGVVTGRLAVDAGGAGAPLFAVEHLEGANEDLGHAAVVRYSPEEKAVVLQGAHPVARAAGSATAPQVDQQDRRPREMLARALGRSEGIRVYVLPGSRPPSYRTPQNPGTQYVEVQGSPVWSWFVNHNVNRTLKSQPPTGFAVHVLFRYLSPGYAKEREAEK
jgi:hypothetical protein